MELIKEKETYIERMFCENERISVDEDIIVPDVKPDILKVLQVDARAYVTDKGIISGGAYAQGKMYVTILYIPDSDADGISCIKTAFDFKSKTDNPALSSDMRVKVSCDVAKADFTAINSRKLAIKGAVSLNFEIFGDKEIEIPYTTDSDETECIYESMDTDRTAVVEECEFQVRDSLEIPNGKKAISEILKTDVRINEKDFKVMQGKLILKGNLTVCILYLTEDGKTDYFESELPFTEVFDVYELEEDDRCVVELSAADVSAELMQDSDGDMRIVNLDVLINASLIASRTKAINIISDCYCPGKKTKVTGNEAVIKRFIGRIKTQNTIKEIITPDDKLPQIVKIYSVVAEPEIQSCKTECGKVDLEGKLRVFVLYITDNSKCPVYSLKKDIPFSYTYECENSMPNMQCQTLVDTEGVSCNLNAAGDIEFRCILKQEILVTEDKKLNFIEEIATEETESDGNIVIFFVRRGDTLWNIAKKYSVKVSDIKEINNLEQDEIFEGQKLIIPGSCA